MVEKNFLRCKVLVDVEMLTCREESMGSKAEREEGCVGEGHAETEARRIQVGFCHPRGRDSHRGGQEGGAGCGRTGV